MARKPLKIDETLVEMLAAKGCTDHEIATILTKQAKSLGTADVDVESLRRKASHIIEHGRAMMKRKIREAQIALTEGDKPNPVMLIWLGKQYLGQADKVEGTNRQFLQIQSGEVWRSAFGVAPGRPVQVSKGVDEGDQPAKAVH